MSRSALSQALFAGILAIFATACRTKKETLRPTADSVQVQASACPSPDSLLIELKAADTHFEWFSARISANTEIDKKSNSFTASLRIRRDSAIWMSITPALGIEVARVLITRDSLKFINRIDGTYFRGDYKYLKEFLQTEVNFEMIQAVLLGNTYLHYQSEKYISDIDNGYCLLSTLRKRRIKRESELEIPEILTQEIWCAPYTHKITRMEMQDYRPVRKFSVQYLAEEDFEGSILPKKIAVLASASRSARIELEYSRFQIDKPLNLPFSIPGNYEPMR